MLTSTGCAAVRQVPDTVEHDQPAARHLREAATALEWLAPVLGAVDDQHRAGQRRRQRDGVVLGRRAQRCMRARGERRRIGLQRPSDEILEHLGRVRFRQQDVRVVVDPAAEVLAPLRLVDGLERTRLRRKGMHAGSDRDEPAHPVRLRGGQQQRPLDPRTQCDHERGVRPGGVQDGCRVTGVDLVGVRGRPLGPVGPAVAARIPGDDAEVPGQEGDLALPLPAVHDRERAHEQHGRRPRPEDLVIRAHAVLDGEAHVVRIPGTHGIHCPVRARRTHHPDQGRAS